MSEKKLTDSEKLDSLVASQERIAGSLEALNLQLSANTINGTYGGAAAGGIMAISINLIKSAFNT